jgi:hypothetical protein
MAATIEAGRIEPMRLSEAAEGVHDLARAF